MALLQYYFDSACLGIRTAVNIALPQAACQNGMETRLPKEKKLPVLYLLHGQGDDHTSW